MKILIVYYSMYGHVFQMARAVEKGVQSVADAEVQLRRVEEFPENMAHIRESDHARPVWEEQEKIPVCSLDDLRTADGILFGTPTRFGNMAAQMKRFIDSTAQLWLESALESKPAGIFTSTATAHGGQETTALTFMVPSAPSGNAHRGSPLLHPRHASHGRSRRHPLRGFHPGRFSKPIEPCPGRSGNRHCPGSTGGPHRFKTQNGLRRSDAVLDEPLRTLRISSC